MSWLRSGLLDSEAVGRASAAGLRRVCWFSALLLFVLLLGCGRGNYPDVAVVTGVVTLDGKPVEGALVTFSPVGGRTSSGRTGQDGSYALLYKKNVQGAILGEHRVSITKLFYDYSPHSRNEASYATEMNARQAELDRAQGLVEGVDFTTSTVMVDREPVNLLPDRYSGVGSSLVATVGPTRNTLNFDLVSDIEGQAD